MLQHDLSHSFLYLLDFSIYYTFDAVNELKIYGFMNTPRRYLPTDTRVTEYIFKCKQIKAILWLVINLYEIDGQQEICLPVLAHLMSVFFFFGSVVYAACYPVIFINFAVNFISHQKYIDSTTHSHQYHHRNTTCMQQTTTG